MIFICPYGILWQEVAIEGEDKVFKDVIEPLESASVNLVPTAKEDVREFGPPEKVLFQFHFENHLISFFLMFWIFYSLITVILLKCVILFCCLFQVAETLIKKFLAPANQKTKLIQAKEVRIFLCFVMLDFIDMIVWLQIFWM